MESMCARVKKDTGSIPILVPVSLASIRPGTLLPPSTKTSSSSVPWKWLRRSFTGRFTQSPKFLCPHANRSRMHGPRESSSIQLANSCLLRTLALGRITCTTSRRSKTRRDSSSSFSSRTPEECTECKLCLLREVASIWECLSARHGEVLEPKT